MIKKIIIALLFITVFSNYSMDKENVEKKFKIIEKSLNDDDGNTILHTCVLNENINNLKLYITYDAEPNVVNKKGETPLQLALEKHNFDIVKTLVHAGASLKNMITYQNKSFTSLEFAKNLLGTEITSYEELEKNIQKRETTIQTTEKQIERLASKTQKNELLINKRKTLIETHKKHIENSKVNLQKIRTSKESLEKIIDYLDLINRIQKSLCCNKHLENLLVDLFSNSKNKKYLQYCFAYFLHQGACDALKSYYTLNKKYKFDKHAANKTEFEYEQWITNKIIEINKSTLLANYIEQS